MAHQWKKNRRTWYYFDPRLIFFKFNLACFLSEQQTYRDAGVPNTTKTLFWSGLEWCSANIYNIVPSPNMFMYSTRNISTCVVGCLSPNKARQSRTFCGICRELRRFVCWYIERNVLQLLWYFFLKGIAD